MAGEMKTALVFLPLLAAWLTGCVGVVVPVPSHDKTYGKVITREQVRFIIPGQTARADVVEKLGSQFRDSPRLPALAYSWEQPAAGLLWFWVIVIPPSGIGDGDYTERSHWRAFFVAFDNSGKVSRTKFVSLSGRKSLDEQLEQWAACKYESCLKNGAHIFNPDTGAPLILESALNHLQNQNRSRQ